MSDLIGRIGRAHPDHPLYGTLTRDELLAVGYVDGRNDAANEATLMRVRIREAIEELETAGHLGCAEIVRARLFHECREGAK